MHILLVPYFFLLHSHFQIWDGQVGTSRVKLYEPWERPGQSLQDLIVGSSFMNLGKGLVSPCKI